MRDERRGEERKGEEGRRRRGGEKRAAVARGPGRPVVTREIKGEIFVGEEG